MAGRTPASLDTYIQHVVDRAPTLTDAQRETLRRALDGDVR